MTLQRGVDSTTASAHANQANVYLASDQRGEPRLRNGALDIGATENQGYTLTEVSGSSPQATGVTTSFTQPLAVILTETNTNIPLLGAVVSYVASTAASVNGESVRRQ